MTKNKVLPWHKKSRPATDEKRKTPLMTVAHDAHRAEIVSVIDARRAEIVIVVRQVETEIDVIIIRPQAAATGDIRKRTIIVVDSSVMIVMAVTIVDDFLRHASDTTIDVIGIKEVNLTAGLSKGSMPSCLL